MMKRHQRIATRGPKVIDGFLELPVGASGVCVVQVLHAHCQHAKCIFQLRLSVIRREFHRPDHDEQTEPDGDE
jgi:hypothetical protein